MELSDQQQTKEGKVMSKMKLSGLKQLPQSRSKMKQFDGCLKSFSVVGIGFTKLIKNGHSWRGKAQYWMRRSAQYKW